jgi:hypothetical protein
MKFDKNMHPSWLSPNVYQVVPTDNYTVYAYMNDGTVRLYDAKHLLKKGNIFENLKDIDFFKKRCAIINGTIAWDTVGTRDAHKCIDIDPCILYDCPIVEDILEKLTTKQVKDLCTF